VRGETRVDDVFDGRVRRQEGGDAECNQTMGLHPHCKSFGTTLGEPTVECTQHRTMGILEETELLDEAIVVSVWCGQGGEVLGGWQHPSRHRNGRGCIL